VEGATAEALARGEAARQAGFQRVADEKAQHQAEIKILGKAIADELRPEFQALVAAIREAMQQTKDSQ
jgi:hypothetical protein